MRKVDLSVSIRRDPHKQYPLSLQLRSISVYVKSSRPVGILPCQRRPTSTSSLGAKAQRTSHTVLRHALDSLRSTPAVYGILRIFALPQFAPIRPLDTVRSCCIEHSYHVDGFRYGVHGVQRITTVLGRRAWMLLRELHRLCLSRVVNFTQC